MSAILTGGRYPAYGEVGAHYCREGFLAFLLQTTHARKVVLVIPTTQHWEPRWDDDRVQGSTIDEVRRWILGRLDQAFPGAPLGERLPFYPSFHQSLERWADAHQEGSPVAVDSVLESDWPTWRESFHDVLTLVDALEREGVPYRMKFSGHRSLHVCVPGAGGALRATPFGESRAHGTKLVRMPFSLNEDTGLVSLPLCRAGLPAFRPWQAALPLAGQCRSPQWLGAPDEEERRRVRVFVAGLKKRPPVERRPYFAAAEVVSCSRTRLDALAAGAQEAATDGTARQRAWTLLRRPQPPAPDQVQACLADADGDAAWLATEALLLRARALPVEHLAPLLGCRDSYVRAAVVDLLECFLDESCAHFAAELRRPDLGAPARWLHLLARSAVLRERLVSDLAGAPEGLGLRVACVTGVHLGRWAEAHEMAAREGAPVGPADPLARRIAALRLMEAMVTAPSWGAMAVHARELAALGPDVVDLVLLAQAAPNERTARAFLLVLAEMGDLGGLEALTRGLGAPNCGSIAIRGLMRIGAPAVPALLEAAGSDDVRTRRYALRCLAFLRDPRAWPTQVAALQDAEGAVRRETARGLHHPAPAVEALVEAARLGTGRPDATGIGAVTGMCSAAYAAVEALASHGGTGAEAIRQLAHDEGNVCAAAWLTGQGDSRARAVLVDALRPASAGSPLSERQLGAALLWAELGADAEVVRALVPCLPGLRSWEQWPILRALAASDLPEALEVILGVGRSSNHHERRCAVRALGECRHPGAPAALVAMATDPDARLREAVVEAALARASAVAPAVAATLARADRAFAGRRTLERLHLCLTVKEQLDRREPLTLELVTAVARGPKPLWDAARRRVADDQTGEAAVQLRALLGLASGTLVRFCVEQLLAAAGEEAAGEDTEDVARHVAPEP
ncbi:MAG: HEAT repeat domain-containing protein [Candidatus Latescibacterota bacterium]